MWVCQNNTRILQEIEKVNQRDGATSIDSFDFSTLYTNINLQDLSTKLKWTVEKAFKGGNNQKITVGRYYTNWGVYNKGHSYTKEDIYDMIDTIINNAYFQVGNKIYRQKIGIPMGTDPAPYMANLYLYSYEFEAMEKLTREDRGKALKFNKTCRFIDDLCGINNNGLMEKMWKDIYPPELILKKENEDNNRTSFLDLDIEIKEKKFITKLYDKRDQFKFDIVSFPFLCGNIPENPAYGVFTAQVLRILRASTTLNDANDRIARVASKLKNQGYDSRKLKKCGMKILGRHQWIQGKFKFNTREIVTMWKNSWMWIIDES